MTVLSLDIDWSIIQNDVIILEFHGLAAAELGGSLNFNGN